MDFNNIIKKAVKKLSSKSFKNRIKNEDISMLKSLPILKKINLLGYVTFESQAGNKTIDNDTEISERSFIIGFMKENNAVKFIKYTNIHTDKLSFYVPIVSNNVYLPATLDIPLTKIYNIKTKKTTIFTHTSFLLPENVAMQYKKQYEIEKNKDIVIVMCIDNIWNRNALKKDGLFINVVKILDGLNSYE
jgi:hypothetical protein